MGKIIILDEDTSNQIAAGEVIERPASIIKELVENSIDANSKNIKVEIRRGGISFIRITDDGHGIDRDDCEMAFERHGTSKIRSANDLHHIVTMGFRGEALASIASIAEVTLVTRSNNEEVGTKLQIKGGQIIKKESTAKEIGTTLTIKSMFYNTPARYKFLKNDTTEGRYCNEIVNKLALANPSISFTFISNNNEIVNTPGDGKLVNTIYSIYGREVASSLYKVEASNNGISLSGYIGKQNIARGNRGNQSLFINKRNIKSFEITKAVEKAYESTLMKGKYPFYVLNMDISASQVDVNVHPQKLEVRFSNVNELFSMVFRTIKGVIESTNTIFVDHTPKKEENIYTTPPVFSDQEKIYTPTVTKRNEYHEQMMSIKQQVQEIRPVMATTENESIEVEKEFLGNYKIIGQLFNTYIILERENDILLLDQHACHERITYENLLDKFNHKKMVKQILLLPVEITFSSAEIVLIIENKERINELGFDFSQFSSNSILVRSVPTDIKNECTEDVFKSAIDNIGKQDHETLYMMACKNSIKANHKLSNLEINEMVIRLSKMVNPFNCPHGRPTIIKMTKYELEKKFKRIV